MKENWTTPEIQLELNDFILPRVQHRDHARQYESFSDARLSPDLLQALFREAEAVHGGMSVKERAFFLRALAASLSYASSSK
ncbi:hypothetical protein, partial [Paraburkholderia sp. RL17-373-BIF-A]|uniref:hypothetical protein n=1 Tax=Paraburkholderia sp. RL17-373-BIF-A TaxID=3031629 RepID=UPI0038BBB898